MNELSNDRRLFPGAVLDGRQKVLVQRNWNKGHNVDHDHLQAKQNRNWLIFILLEVFDADNLKNKSLISNFIASTSANLKCWSSIYCYDIVTLQRVNLKGIFKYDFYV